MAKALKSEAKTKEGGRITTPDRTEDDALESSLRPKTLSDFVGSNRRARI